MNDYATLHESIGRYTLRFERYFHHNQEDIYDVITDANYFTQWYPFASGEMDLRLGGKIGFDDGEGTTYTATITELEEAHLFGFREVDDLINISLHEKGEGCQMVFTHTFENDSWVVNIAAGWHRCLDVLGQIVRGEPIKWHDNSAELREIYRERLSSER